MAQTAQDAVAEIVRKDTWTAEDHAELLKRLFETTDAPRKFKDMLAAMESANPDARGAAALKIGVARYMVGRFGAALEALGNAADSKDRRFFAGLCHKQLRQYGKAAEEFRKAAEKGGEADAVEAQLVEVMALGGDLDAAEKALAALAKRAGDTADALHLRGLIAELRGFTEEAGEAYEKAHALDPNHAGAAFRLAYHYDLHGDEQAAVELYKECVKHPPVHANALLNLAVLYEDMGRYEQAAKCLRHILATNPAHERARLFLRDAEASQTMYYDEDQARRMARRSAVLDIPVTDFELSVRARNCLKKMNIYTLGDLVRTSETELLAYKNFGETSLTEIRAMLAAKGLHLGQALEEGSELSGLPSQPPPPPINEGILATPIEHVELPVRARRALESLKVETLGDLIAKTEAELLACRNFGQTSLNEVRQRLAEYGLSLREP